jgi:lysophospholipid acyltransferase (LPLAT)-like uncharacterized protein
MAAAADWLLLKLVPPVAAGIIRLLHALLRVEVIGGESPREFWARGENVILAFWHDQLLLMVHAYKGPAARLLISSSKDGELLARTMASFGLGAVRGSSTRGGRAAFRALVDLAREPVDLALTPDGPKGPRHLLKEGVVQLARLSGRPVIPMAFACSRGHRFASWDHFLLPYPLARGVFSIGEPVRFVAGEDPGAFQARLQQAMEENERRARARLEDFGVSAV